MNKLHIHERICISRSERANVYADVHNTCLTYTPAHAWCSQHLSKRMHTLHKEMHLHSCMRAYAAVQKLLWHGSYCELILSLARASCRLSFATRPPASSSKYVARRCSLKKSVQIHASSWRGHRCGVAQVSFDHPRWCRPHPIHKHVSMNTFKHQFVKLPSKPVETRGIRPKIFKWLTHR